MSRPPMSRVLTPQLVAQACSNLPFFVLELHVERLGEILPEEVRRAGLQRPPVLHHRLDAERVDGAGELLALALGADQHRHRHPFLGEPAVDLDHLPRLVLGFLLRGVGGVAFLPEEFGRAQEEPRPHLPADDVAPLVDEQRQSRGSSESSSCRCSR